MHILEQLVDGHYGHTEPYNDITNDFSQPMDHPFQSVKIPNDCEKAVYNGRGCCYKHHVYKDQKSLQCDDLYGDASSLAPSDYSRTNSREARDA